MSESRLPGRVFFLDEWGSAEHAEEVAAGRPVFFVPRDDRQVPLPTEPMEWPAGWVEVGATTGG
jgi:hypothetical protein